MKLAQMDAELDKDPDMDFFGEELMQELVHKPSAGEKATTDQVLGYASEVVSGNVLRSSGVSKSLWYIKKENETWKVTFIREHP